MQRSYLIYKRWHSTDASVPKQKRKDTIENNNEYAKKNVETLSSPKICESDEARFSIVRSVHIKDDYQNGHQPM